MEAIFTHPTLMMKPRDRTNQTEMQNAKENERSAQLRHSNGEVATQAGLVAAGEGCSARRWPLPADVEGVVDLQVALPVVVEELPKQQHNPLMYVTNLNSEF
uniref:Rho GDP-dissociation inhibitor 1 n=1 Tax=Arundo donax TaxID=35708 RepID=A0A0A9DRX1_ARUDO